jgi:hypothetical protein
MKEFFISFSKVLFEIIIISSITYLLYSISKYNQNKDNE